MGITALATLGIFITWNNSTSGSFRCPNEYETAEKYITGVTEWANEEFKKSPTMTQGELFREREKLFNEYSCEPSHWSALPDGF